MLNDTTRCLGNYAGHICTLRETCQRYKQIAEDAKRTPPPMVPMSRYLGEAEGMGYRCRNRIAVETT